jgi:hypothetical protein
MAAQKQPRVSVLFGFAFKRIKSPPQRHRGHREKQRQTQRVKERHKVWLRDPAILGMSGFEGNTPL